jgi:hypothetical protein
MHTQEEPLFILDVIACGNYKNCSKDIDNLFLFSDVIEILSRYHMKIECIDFLHSGFEIHCEIKILETYFDDLERVFFEFGELIIKTKIEN